MFKNLFILLSFTFSFSCYSLSYKSISKNTHAKVLFEEGMLLYYAYSYPQAEHNFRTAIQYDPTCGPCFLGLALAKKQQAIELGKSFANIGFKEVQQAKNLLKKEQKFYLALTLALEKTFTDLTDYNLNTLQKNYIEELKILNTAYSKHPEWHAEALALLVDAISYFPISDSTTENFHCGKKLQENFQQEAIELMQKYFQQKNVTLHPGILHTYIHMKERDLTDPYALLAAKNLPNYHHNYIAHFAHMPNHIYWRRGMYNEAILANLQAIKLDENYFKKSGIGLSSYYYEYHFLHSQHFLSVLGYLTNNYDLAIKNAREIKNLMDYNRMKDISDYRDIFLTLEHVVLAQFNRWQEIENLNMPYRLGQLGTLFLNFSKALSALNKMQEKNYINYFNEINTLLPEKKYISEIKNLILVYLNSTKMMKNNLSFKEIETYIQQNQIFELEEKFHKNNPPMWLFPSSLLLANYAYKLGDKQTGDKYHGLYLKQYPNASFGKNEPKS